MKLSACIIAKNEEKNIAKAIESFKSEVDEIIVVDTGSTDRTVEIAESLGARVHFFEWNGSFADAKNHALEKASGEWIVFLDADEYFSKETSKNIRKAIKKYTKTSGRQIESLVFKRYDIDVSTGVILSTGWSQRVFRSSLRYSGSIHEGLRNERNETIQANRVPEKDLLLFHTGYSKEIIETKHDRNLVLLEDLLKRYEEAGPDVKQIKGEMERSMVYFYLSSSYMSHRKFVEAERFARMFIESGTKTLEGDSIPYRVVIACKMQIEKKPQLILDEINIAVEKFPDFPDFIDFRGMINFKKGLYFKAKTDFEKAIELNSNFNKLDTTHFGYSIGQTYKYLGGIYNHYSNSFMAKEMLLKSINSNPNDVETLGFLFRVLQNVEEIEAALDEIDFGKTKDQLEKLVNAAMSVKMNEVIVHFLTKLQKTTELSKEQEARLLYANKQFSEAFVAYKTLGNSEGIKAHHEILLLLCALLSEQDDQISWVSENLTNETVKKAFKCLAEGRILSYDQSEKETLELLMNEIGQAEALQLYHVMWLNYVTSIRNSAYLFLDTMSEIGYDRFIIDLIEDVLKVSGQTDGILYNKLALLYLRVGDSEKSLLNAAKAFELGNFDHVSVDVVEWLIDLNQTNLAILNTANGILEFASGIRAEVGPDFSFFLSGRITRLDPTKVLEAYTS